jgi:predicted dehydrogenase
VRKLRFFQPRQYVSLDYSRRDAFMLTVKPDDASGADGHSHEMPAIVPAKPQVVPEEPLKAELRSFLEAVAGRSRPLVTLEDGRRALALALEIRAAIEEHSARAGLPELMHAE